MKKPGRNAPCPCGSGKKYKKCCLHAPGPKANAGGTLVYSDLDDLSNQIPELVRQGKYDEAEEVCLQLQKQYPDQIDGLHRSAELFEAMEDYDKATTFYNKAAEFAEQAEEFEQKSVEYFRNKAEQFADIGKQ